MRGRTGGLELHLCPMVNRYNTYYSTGLRVLITNDDGGNNASFVSSQAIEIFQPFTVFVSLGHFAKKFKKKFENLTLDTAK